MSRAKKKGWEELNTESRRQCPKLFYHFSTTFDSFTLLFTDLIGIWETSLDETDILAAAARLHSSIDPSVSPKQLSVLLSKIQTSLAKGENFISRDRAHDSRILYLSTTLDLPRPLRPLEWQFILQPHTTSELAERILRPSLHEVAISQGKVSSLLATIKEKDHVISRLLERIGNSAIDLSLVFPGIAGFTARSGGHVSVEDAKKYVPGMTEFDEKAWTKQLSDDEGYEGADRTGLSNLVKGCEKCFAHTKAEHESWVKDLPTGDEVDLSAWEYDGGLMSPLAQLAADAEEENKRKEKREKKKPARHDESTEDEFERQPTPPGLKSKTPPPREIPPSSATVEEDAKDEELPPAKRAKPFRIGALRNQDASKLLSKERPQRQIVTAREVSPSASTAASTTSDDEADEAEEDKHQTGSDKPDKSARPEARNSELGKFNKKPPAATRSPSATPIPTPSPEPTRVQPPRSVTDTNSKPSPEGDNNDKDENQADETLDQNQSPYPLKKSAPTPTRRLGRLAGGGLKKQDLPSKSPTKEPDPHQASESSSPPNEEMMIDSPKPKKAGKLGGLRKKQNHHADSKSEEGVAPSSHSKSTKHGANSPSAAANSTSPSPSSSVPAQNLRSKVLSPSPASPPETEHNPDLPPPAAEKETPQEAATRRRMELKRTIETGGGRKKRRF